MEIEWVLAGEHLVGEARQCVHVVTRVAAAERVPRRNAAQYRRCRIQRHDVEQAHLETFGDEHVPGAELAVNHRLGVQELQGVADGPDDGQRLVQWQRVRVVEHEAQRGAVEAFHDDIAEFAVVVAVQVGDDIRVRSCAKHGVAQLEFAEESVVQGNPVRQQLDGDPPADAEFAIPLVACLVDVTEAAAADLRVQAITARDQAGGRLGRFLLVAEFE